MTTAFAPLIAALDARAARGETARFWLRDDDAVEPTPALDRLIGLTADHAVPCLLAVIPAHSGARLATRLDGAPHVSVAQHGWSHMNHAAPTAKKCELGADRPLPEVLSELAAGMTRLRSWHGPRFLPILVPPWNRIAPAVADALGALGFQALSVFGPEKTGRIPRLNTQIDLIDWHGNRGGRDPAALVADLLAALDAGLPDIGLLTHHLVHDAAAWRFVADLLGHTSRHPACQWHGAQNLLHDRLTPPG